MEPQEFFSSSLFTDPSIPTSNEERQSKRRRYGKKEEDILAFGYEVKIYNDKDLAKKIDQGKLLIPWKSCNSSRITMDRFDVRHLIQNEELFRVTQKSLLEEEYDPERYADLTGKDESSQQSSSINNAAIPYDYNKSERKEKTILKDNISTFEKEIRKKYNTPKSMIVPTTPNLVELIESISREVSSATNPNLLEIRIQVKNANNIMYSFLNKQDPLYEFYKHIVSRNSSSKKITLKSLVAYSDSDDSSSGGSDDSDKEEEDDKIPSEVKMIIQKTALSIASSSDSNQLEEFLRLRKGNENKFSFLNKGNIYFNYFQSQIKQKKKSLI